LEEAERLVARVLRGDLERTLLRDAIFRYLEEKNKIFLHFQKNQKIANGKYLQF
jgi:hypothetical protein